MSKDYTLNKEHAEELADKIQGYWHSRGHEEVEVWVEAIPVYNRNTATKVTTRFEINSNILQDVASLDQNNII